MIRLADEKVCRDVALRDLGPGQPFKATYEGLYVNGFALERYAEQRQVLLFNDTCEQPKLRMMPGAWLVEPCHDVVLSVS